MLKVFQMKCGSGPEVNQDVALFIMEMKEIENGNEKSVTFIIVKM